MLYCTLCAAQASKSKLVHLFVGNLRMMGNATRESETKNATQLGNEVLHCTQRKTNAHRWRVLGWHCTPSSIKRIDSFLVRLPLSTWLPIWELTCQIVCLLDQRLLLPASHDRPGLFVGGMWCGHHRASIRVIALITRPPGPPTVWAMHSGQPNPSRQKKLSQEWVRV